MENSFWFGMLLNEIFVRRLQSSSWIDIISSVYLCLYTSSWKTLEFHSVCLQSVRCNYTIKTNGLVSELYTENVKLYWKFLDPVNCSFLLS